MSKPHQPGFFDVESSTAKLTEMGDPLVGLNAQIDWEVFRSDLERIHVKARKSNAGKTSVPGSNCFSALWIQGLQPKR